MSMGMMILPPIMISLPFKVLLFIMVDGWNLITRTLVSSFITWAGHLGHEVRLEVYDGSDAVITIAQNTLLTVIYVSAPLLLVSSRIGGKRFPGYNADTGGDFVFYPQDTVCHPDDCSAGLVDAEHAYRLYT